MVEIKRGPFLGVAFFLLIYSLGEVLRYKEQEIIPVEGWNLPCLVLGSARPNSTRSSDVGHGTSQEMQDGY